MKVVMKGFQPPVSKTYYHWEKGIEAHGDQYITIEDPNWAVSYADCWYQTNMLKNKFLHEDNADNIGAKYLHIIKSGRPWIVSESNPFREFGGYTRFGWHSYLYDGNFNNHNVGRERWNKFVKDTGITFKDWGPRGDYILIIGQKEGDSSLRHLYADGWESMYSWMAKIIRDIRRYTVRPIRIRPHPKNLTRGMKHAHRIQKELNLPHVYISDNFTSLGSQGGEGLDKDIRNAHCVVTWNSNSAIECATRGIPFYSLDPFSLTHEISQKGFETIEKLNLDIPLENWQNKIAYTIWNKEEVHTGEAWAHLRPVYFR